MLARLAHRRTRRSRRTLSLWCATTSATKTYVCDPRHDKDAVDQIVRRCDKLGTTTHDQR